MWTEPSRLAACIVIGSLLAGCVALTGRVNTLSQTAPPHNPLFKVISPDSISLTERIIREHIEKKMAEHGYRKASPEEVPNVAVLYKYSVGSGIASVSSSPDFVWGGQRVESSSEYPRFFEIVLVDLEKSQAPEAIKTIWQGEVYSSGSSTNISRLAPHFIDVLFENYWSTVTNRRFSKFID
jgi:hypothetical protein